MHGILPLWKEKGMTSHDCVVRLRKMLGTKKVGHTGTLDPNVEGVLPICIGHATKIASYITDLGKEYEAVITIGFSTETEDADGLIVEQDDSLKSFSREMLLQVLSQLTGDIKQTPPYYSAVKVNGKKLYEYARKGIEVERPSRIVRIDQIDLLEERQFFEGTTISFKVRVRCGKGTYIRTLAVQIGELLGYPAHMSALVRTASGPFLQGHCLTLQQVKELHEEQQLLAQLHPIECALQDVPFVEVDEKLYNQIKNGQVLPQHPLLLKEEQIVFSLHGKALAVYQKHPSKENLMKPATMLPF